MRLLLTFCWASFILSSQQTTGATASAPLPIPLSTGVTWTPKIIVTGGGGFASPNGKFAYASESTFVGAATYTTVAVEDTLIHGNVESCTLAGISKIMYQFSILSIGITGLGGGCTSTTGSAIGAASGQGFLDIRWGKTAFGNMLTVTKNTSGGWKATLGFRWAQ